MSCWPNGITAKVVARSIQSPPDPRPGVDGGQSPVGKHNDCGLELVPNKPVAGPGGIRGHRPGRARRSRCIRMRQSIDDGNQPGHIGII